MNDKEESVWPLFGVIAFLLFLGWMAAEALVSWVQAGMPYVAP